MESFPKHLEVLTHAEGNTSVCKVKSDTGFHAMDDLSDAGLKSYKKKQSVSEVCLAVTWGRSPDAK